MAFTTLVSRRFYAACAFLSALGVPAVAHAQDAMIAACIAANESSIERQSQHKLLEARALSLKCAADPCPPSIRAACGRRVAKLNDLMPTIVFEAKDGAGADVAVKLTMDGKPVESGDGTSVAGDPGEHKFVFVAPGQAPIEKTFILREGERNRRESILVGPAPVASVAPGPSAAPSAPAPLAPRSAGWNTSRTLAVAAGGVGVVGIGLGTAFGLLARGSWNSSQSECSLTNCPASVRGQAVSDRNSAETSATISTIAIVTGGIGLAAGAVLFWFVAPRETAAKSPPARAIRFSPSLGPGYSGLLVGGFF